MISIQKLLDTSYEQSHELTWDGPTDLMTYQIHDTKGTGWNSPPTRDILTDLVTYKNSWFVIAQL